MLTNNTVSITIKRAGFVTVSVTEYVPGTLYVATGKIIRSRTVLFIFVKVLVHLLYSYINVSISLIFKGTCT